MGIYDGTGLLKRRDGCEWMMREDNEVDSFLLKMAMLSKRANEVISNEMKYTNFETRIVNIVFTNI